MTNNSDGSNSTLCQHVLKFPFSKSKWPWNLFWDEQPMAPSPHQEIISQIFFLVTLIMLWVLLLKQGHTTSTVDHHSTAKTEESKLWFMLSNMIHLNIPIIQLAKR